MRQGLGLGGEDRSPITCSPTSVRPTPLDGIALADQMAHADTMALMHAIEYVEP